MCLEQTINRSQKGTSGIIGSSRRKQYVSEWEIIYHEMLAVSYLHRQESGVSTQYYELSINHEFTKAQTVKEEKHITSHGSIHTKP